MSWLHRIQLYLKIQISRASTTLTNPTPTSSDMFIRGIIFVQLLMSISRNISSQQSQLLSSFPGRNDLFVDKSASQDILVIPCHLPDSLPPPQRVRFEYADGMLNAIPPQPESILHPLLLPHTLTPDDLSSSTYLQMNLMSSQLQEDE